MIKIICALLSVCMLLCLAACGRGTEQNRVSETTEATQSNTVAENPTEAVSQPPAETVAATEEQTATGVTQTQGDGEENVLKPLTLEKTLHTYFEWEEGYDYALVRSENACVTLGQEDAQRFPEMAEVLRHIATMQENAMLDEFDNLVSFAREEYDKDRDNFEPYVSTLYVQVRRADSLVISLLSDSYSDFGLIDNYRVFHGTNYDPQTGRELALNEVVDVNNDLALAVQKELTGHMWTGEFHYKYVVEDYFANTGYHEFSWTLDYNGVTFYFAPGEFCDGGAMTATVSFAQYPELFNEKYMAVPEQYTVELPLDLSFFTELDADGAMDAFAVSGFYDLERNCYLDYSVFTDTDDQFYYEECYAHDLHPYYVKTADGHYLYLFCEDFQEGARQFALTILNMNPDGSVTKVGQRNVSPAWLADNRFIVPSNPAKLILDDLDSELGKQAFKVGDDGIPYYLGSE